MFPKRHLWALLCISLTAASVASAQYSSPFLSLKDAYPERDSLLKGSMKLCSAALAQMTLPTTELSKLVGTELFKNASVLHQTNDDSGWTAELKIEDAIGGYLKIIKSGSDFTMSYRQKENAIEGIADISISDHCQSVNEARFTYFNSSRRPIRRIKLNSQLQRVQTVIMEDPVQDSKQSSADGKDVLKVGIIDSGIDYNHPSLIAKSRPMLGVDLTDPERPPYDYTNTVQNELMGRSFSHGTGVADVASRNIDVLIVPVRTENQSQLDGKAVEFLAAKKVRLVNISQGTVRKEDWLPLKEAMERHPEMLFIVSAGNNSKNLSTEPDYPSAFTLPNMLVVASVDRQGHLSSFSNYSSKFVHLAALGENVSVAQAGGGTKIVNGTSFSAPLVTNIAAQILIQNPNLSAQDLRARLIQKAKPSPELKEQVQYGIISAE